jgi:hypothetical protein
MDPIFQILAALSVLLLAFGVRFKNANARPLRVLVESSRRGSLR